MPDPQPVPPDAPAEVAPFSITKLGRAARKALATFVFATGGVLIANPILDMDVASWKLALGTGAGSLLNLAYRWAERAKDA